MNPELKLRSSTARCVDFRSLAGVPMLLPSENRNAAAFQRHSPEDEAALLNRARLLQAASLRRAPALPLKGKNLGVLCSRDAEQSESCALFERAAAELGARVTALPPSFAELGSARELPHAAQILGRFYDAVECLGLTPELVRQIAREASIPVYDGAASNSHPTAQLAARLGDLTSPTDNRRFVLQSLLLGSIA
jgi:ornithine carbamoyltransferase